MSDPSRKVSGYAFFVMPTRFDTKITALCALGLVACGPPQPDAPSLFKLFVTADGWSRVEAASLFQAGLPQSTDPQSLSLTRRGQQVAMRIVGEQDGTLDADDAIEFFGQAEDTVLTGTGLYWLATQPEVASRIGFANDEPAGPFLLQDTYLARARKQFRSLYLASVMNGPRENFFGPPIPVAGLVEELRVDHYRPQATVSASFFATLSLTLQGVTAAEHYVGVTLNGSRLATLVFSNQASHDVQLPIPEGVLSEGTNTLVLTKEGGPGDISLIDALTLSYPRALVAVDDELEFEASPNAEVSVSGFSTDDVQVFDLSDARTPTEVSALTEGGTVRFRTDTGPTRRFLAKAVGRSLTVSQVKSARPAQLGDGSHEGELLIITAAELRAGIEPLASARRLEGLSVFVADVDDVYDAYAFGVKDSSAIKAFIEDAYRTWAKPPRYVLLVGDASDDPRDRLGLGDFDLVPTPMVATLYLETASDDGFVDFDDNGVPELAIGRFPARTPDELSTMVAKTLAYRPKPLDSRLSGVFLSDEPLGFSFETVSRSVAYELEGGLSSTHIVRQSNEVGLLPAMLEALQTQPDVFAYFGHASTQQWAGPSLSNATVPNLPSASVLPVFINMACFNGYFQSAIAESLGEALIKAPSRGAAAVWVSSGLTEAREQVPLMGRAFRHLVVDQLPLGDALRLAKSEVVEEDVRRTWMLLGDPTLRLWTVPWN
ncbi:MAG: C25 family cysteine peptidase [Myxococcaceae bacterium]